MRDYKTVGRHSTSLSLLVGISITVLSVFRSVFRVTETWLVPSLSIGVSHHESGDAIRSPVECFWGHDVNMRLIRITTRMVPDVEGLFVSDPRLGCEPQSFFVIGFNSGKQALIIPRSVSRDVRRAISA